MRRFVAWVLMAGILLLAGCNAGPTEPARPIDPLATAAAPPGRAESGSAISADPPRASPTATAAPVPPTAGARGAVRERVRAAAALIGPQYFQQRDQVVAELEAALRAYLEQVAPLGALQDDAARADLADLLTLLPPTGPSAGQATDRPTVGLVTVLPHATILVVGWHQVGLPLVTAYPLGERVRVTTLQPGPPGGLPDPNARVRLEQVTDLTGDGQPELVLSSAIQGGSGLTTILGVLGWTGQGFTPLLTESLSQWAGPASWTVAPNGAAQDVVIRCPAFGPFDHKLLPHPQLSRAFHWDGQAFALRSATLTPAQYQRDAFNRAEVAFRAGDLATAIARYRTVIDEPGLQPDRDTPTHWPALAWLRIGESQALAGDLGGAHQSLAQAEQAGGTIGALAHAFQSALGQPDGVVRGLAALQMSDLAQRVHDETAGNIGFEVDAAGMISPGLAISAYLQQHAEAAGDSARELRAALERLGLQVTDLARVDLDGDGQEEVVGLLPIGTITTGWIVARQEGGWRALRLSGDGVSWSRIGPVEARPDRPGNVLTLVRAGNVQPADTRVSLAQGAPQFFAPDGTPLPQASPFFPGQCSIAEGLGTIAQGARR